MPFAPIAATLRRLTRPILAALALAALPAGGLAQTGPPASPLLAPPTLPSLLPQGGPLPVLPPGGQAEALQRLLDAGATRGPPPGLPRTAPVPAPAAQALPPPLPAGPPEEPLSSAEAFFAARMEGPPLRQFGYETFRHAPPAQQGFGALPEDYVLGPDDELIVAFRGRARQTLTLRVGRDGNLLLPDLAPIPAAGRSLKDLRAHLEGLATRDLGGSEVFVSIGQVRQLSVFVAGEVMRPGFQPLNALSTVLDALSAAGGVRKTGSLRAIRIEGPRGRRVVDLYAVIADAPGEADLSLREGDRIVVPPVGGTVAIAGDVARPGIYELPARASGAPVAEMLALAGGTIRPGGNRLLVQQNDGAGRRAFAELAPGSALRRGDALLVQPGADVVANQVRLAGHVAVPVLRAAGGGRQGQTLRGLISDRRLLRNDPYVRLGVVWRADARTGSRRFIPFDLGRVLEGRANMALQEGDEVIVFARSDIAFLASPAALRALRGEAPAPPAQGAAPPPDCPALTALALASRASPQRFAHAKGAGFPEIGAAACPQVFLDYPDLPAFLLDQAVVLTGEVRSPGLLPITDDTGLDLAIAAAGGLSDAADLRVVEFAREPADASGSIPLQRTRLDLSSRNFAAIRLSPRDTIRIPRGFGDRENGPVILVGEFLRPGTYDIRRGERLSEVIARAGGLTPQAYPYGAVFTRESVRQRQQEGFQRTARELETSLIQVAAGQAVAGTRGASVDLGSAITAGRELANSLREARAAGRMVVEANPVILAARPELDVLLEPGDVIAMPKRPNEVTVVGSVLNPGSLQFRSGWRASDYVRASGGPQRFADPSRAFIVLPNGQSTAAGLSAWQQGGPPVPPGSLVVVPQDPSPYETWGFVRDLTQVLGQVSVSAAALAVIAREANR